MKNSIRIPFFNEDSAAVLKSFKEFEKRCRRKTLVYDLLAWFLALAAGFLLGFYCRGMILSAEAQSSLVAVGLVWDPVTQDVEGNPETVIGYRMYAGALAPNTLKGEVHWQNNGTIFLEPGVTHLVAVTAFDGFGNESAKSEAITVMVPLPPPTTGVPGTPTGLVVRFK